MSAESAQSLAARHGQDFQSNQPLIILSLVAIAIGRASTPRSVRHARLSFALAPVDAHTARRALPKYL
jgi:hypothetical protein